MASQHLQLSILSRAVRKRINPIIRSQANYIDQVQVSYIDQVKASKFNIGPIETQA
jgi:hypothetical protein